MNHFACSVSGLPTHSAWLHTPTGMVVDSAQMERLISGSPSDIGSQFVPLQVDLGGNSPQNPQQILDEECRHLQEQLVNVTAENEVLSRELAHLLLKKMVLREGGQLGQPQQKPVLSPTGQIESGSSVAGALRQFYSSKIEANRKLKAETFGNHWEWGVPRLLHLPSRVKTAIFSDKKRFLLICDEGGTARLVDTGTGLVELEFPLEEEVAPLELHEKSGSVHLFGWGGGLCRWDFPLDQREVSWVRLEGSLPGGVQCLQMHPSGEHLVGSSGNDLVIWQPWTGQLLQKTDLKRPLERIQVHPDGKLVAVVFRDDSPKVHFFDLIDRKLAISVSLSSDKISTLGFAVDRFHLLVDGPANAELIDLRTRKVTRVPSKGECQWALHPLTPALVRCGSNEIEISSFSGSPTLKSGSFEVEGPRVAFGAVPSGAWMVQEHCLCFVPLQLG